MMMSSRLLYFYSFVCLLVVSLLAFDSELFLNVARTLIDVLFVSINLPEVYLPKAYNLISSYVKQVPSGYNLVLAILLFISIQLLVFLFARHQANYWVILLAILLFPILNFFIEPVLFRRVIFTILFFPIIFRIHSDLTNFLFQLPMREGFKRLLRLFSVISILIFIMPGFYLPPFFDGIAGWSVKKVETGYALSSLRIKFNDASTAWFKGSFFNPLTMRGRPEMVIQTRDADFFRSGFGCLLYDLYLEAFPSLNNGLLPTQKILGAYAYAPHSTDRMLSTDIYKNPEEILQFEYIRILNDGSQSVEEISQIWTVERC